jgi:hypothetical protein
MKAKQTDKFFIYPKDKDGNHTGHTICVISVNGRMYQGIALCNKNDQFSKKIGQELSEERARDAAARHCPAKKPKKALRKVFKYEVTLIE